MRAALTAVALLLLVAVASVVTVRRQSGRVLYVTTTGSASNDGSFDRPLTLARALSSSGPVRPGDTVWVRGGTYLGPFSSTIAGTSGSGLHITVRAYANERATIDNSSITSPALTVTGADVWFWGLEVTDSHPTRVVTGGYNPPRSTSVFVLGPRTKFINMIVHDGEQGFGFWSAAPDAELYGNLIYYVGFDSDNRGHGHSIYVQNETGSKRMVDNILHHGYGYGIHAYTEGGFLNNLHMEGNISYQHGAVSTQGWRTSNYLLRGKRDFSRNPIYRFNVAYYDTPGGRSVDISSTAENACTSLTMTDNWWVSTPQYALFGACQGVLEFARNLVIGEPYGYGMADPTSYPSTYPNNTWLRTMPTTGVAVRVRPNQYEAGRSHIAILNYDRRAAVSVDLSGTGLTNGAAFSVRDAMNYYGPAVVQGTYSGQPVLVPMTGLVPARMVGNVPFHPAHTAPAFGAFIVVPGVAGGPPPPPPPPPSNIPPTVSLATNGTVFTAPATVKLAATASDDGTIKDISFYAGAVLLSSGVAPTYNWVNPPVGAYTLTAKATDNLGAATTSNAVQIEVRSAPTPPPPPGGTSASFVRMDTTTKGNWKGVYGAVGYRLAEETAALPSTVQVVPSGHWGYVWASSTTDVRALQRGTLTGRIAATWYATDNFAIDVTMTDGVSRSVAFYMMDWDRRNRGQRLDVFDATTNALLDTRTMAPSSFNEGVYAVWRFAGKVRLKITRLGTSNPVISGVFIE